MMIYHYTRMVKVLPTQHRQLLANFEVASLVAQHQESEKKKSKVKRVANKAGFLNYLKYFLI